MKIVFSIFMITFSVISQSQSKQEAIRQLRKFSDEEMPQIMILGTFHFAEYAGDQSGNTFTGNPPDVMSEKRQTELQELRDNLAKFRPTKICVENKYYNQKKVNEQYRSFLTGETEELPRNETFQVAYKLARSLQHDSIYAVDADNHWFMDSLVNYALQNNQGELLMKAQQVIPVMLNQMYSEMADKTMTEIFQDMNTEEEIRYFHSFHLEFCTIGKGESFIGTDLYADWMKRNMKIFTNINRITEKNDRILVIYGASHVHSLRQMFDDSINYQLVEPSKYLR